MYRSSNFCFFLQKFGCKLKEIYLIGKNSFVKRARVISRFTLFKHGLPLTAVWLKKV